MKLSDLPRRQAEMKERKWRESIPNLGGLVGVKGAEFAVKRKPDGTLVALITSRNQPLFRKNSWPTKSI